MRTLFVRGKVRCANLQDVHDLSALKFEASGLDESSREFKDALWHLTTYFSSYSTVKGVINSKDVYYLYAKNHCNIARYMRKFNWISEGNIEDTNEEGCFISPALYNINISFKEGQTVLVDSTIFWDVVNYCIVIIGTNNYNSFIKAIEGERGVEVFYDNNESLSNVNIAI